jgi:adenine-specific DNA-methyltransferase
MARPGKKADRLAATVEPSLVGAHCQIHLPKPPPTPMSRRSVPTHDSGPPSSDGNSPEEAFLRAVPTVHRKQFGQFFTPRVIADLMCEWVLETQPQSVLDPAAGPGIFVRTVRDQCTRSRITAIEKDPVAMVALRGATLQVDNLEIVHDDFLLWESEACFDGIIANPPYLRHHDLNYDQDIFAIIGQRSGVQLSRLTNIYGLFVLEICRRLRSGGRAAIIVPGEWLNANFGAPLKRFLLDRRLLRHLVYFSHAETIFADALTTACLLFLERPHPDTDASEAKGIPWESRVNSCPSATLHTIYVHSAEDLAPIRHELRTGNCSSPKLTSRQLSHSILLEHSKWNALLEHGPGSIPDGFVTLGELATTRRGIATGANPFFHVSRTLMERWKLPLTVGSPCVGRAADVHGYIFSEEDFRLLEEATKRTRLLCLGEKLTALEVAYLREGERLGLPRRYLLAARKPWYRMESRPASAIWAAVFGRKELRFIWNEAGVQNLTTFHCIYPRQLNTEQIQALVACLNSPTVQQLARQQQRVYGGGLLKFEPRDLLEIPVPDLRQADPKTVRALAGLLVNLNGAKPHPSDLAAMLPQLDFAVGAVASEAAAKMLQATSRHPSSFPV